MNRSAQGAGLGLAISRELVRGMRAELTVTSEPGTGSIFVLTMPRVTAPAPTESAGAPSPVDAVRAPVEASARRATFERPGDPVLDELRHRLRSGGVGDVLGYLNAHTHHRFTGLYRFDGAVLRNIALFDREQQHSHRGADSPLSGTYCAIVAETQASVAIIDGSSDSRAANNPGRKAVLSYCGALVRDTVGTPIGTLCSLDPRPQPVMDNEVVLLEAEARMLGRPDYARRTHCVADLMVVQRVIYPLPHATGTKA